MNRQKGSADLMFSFPSESSLTPRPISMEVHARAHPLRRKLSDCGLSRRWQLKPSISIKDAPEWKPPPRRLDGGLEILFPIDAAQISRRLPWRACTSCGNLDAWKLRAYTRSDTIANFGQGAPRQWAPLTFLLPYYPSSIIYPPLHSACCGPP